MPCTNCSSVKHCGQNQYGKKSGHREYIAPQPKLPYSGCPGNCANVGCPPRTTTEMQQNKQKLRFLQQTEPWLFYKAPVAIARGVSPSIKQLSNGNYSKGRPFGGSRGGCGKSYCSH